MNFSIRTGLYSDQAKNDLVYLLRLVNYKYPAIFFRVMRKINGELAIEENSLIVDKDRSLSIITAPSILNEKMPISISSSSLFSDESLLWIFDDVEFSVVRFPERLAFLIDFLRNDMPIDELAKKHPILLRRQGLGMMYSLELTKKKGTFVPFEKPGSVGRFINEWIYANEGAIIRNNCYDDCDIIVFCPAITFTFEQCDKLIEALDHAFTVAEEKFGVEA